LKPRPRSNISPKHILQTHSPNQIQTHPVFTISASMSLEGKLEVVSKNNQRISASNQELKDYNQELKDSNEYLRRQLSKLMK